MASSVRRDDESHHRLARAVGIAFSATHLVATLADGRRIETPLDWYPRLLAATSAMRDNWRLIGTGSGIHWPDLDEDLSIDGMLAGRSARSVLPV
jgi:hypothetical protein